MRLLEKLKCFKNVTKFVNDTNLLNLWANWTLTKKQMAVTALVFILNLLDVSIEETENA